MRKDDHRLLQKTSATELVDEQTEAALVAAHYNIARIEQARWFRRRQAAIHDVSGTPAGRVEVLLRAGFEVYRNGEPLVSPTCGFGKDGERKAALFRSREAAHIAALLHSMDGWGASGPDWLVKLDDKLSWWVSPDQQVERQPQPLELYKPDAPDDGSGYVIPWGLVRYVEEFCEDHRNGWGAFTQPAWERMRDGVYVLQSPRGPLCVYKKIGWCLQRNNWPLCNSFGLQTVVQNLEDAQTLALIYSRYSNEELGEPMHWHNPNDPTPDIERWNARQAAWAEAA
jgi:hypothetical protein